MEILTEDDKRMLKDAIAMAKDIEVELDKAARADMDVKDLRAALLASKAKAQKIMSVYFPQG